MNEIHKYYAHQAGNGLVGFRGVRYQKGHGFFGRLLSGAVYPLLRFLGKNLLETGVNVAGDVLSSDDFSLKNIKDITKTRARSKAQDILNTTMSKMRGSGSKRVSILSRKKKRKPSRKKSRRKRSNKLKLEELKNYIKGGRKVLKTTRKRRRRRRKNNKSLFAI